MGDLDVKSEVLELEKHVVKSTLAENRQMPPFIGATLLPQHATKYVELKIMEDMHGQPSWHIGIPVDCFEKGKLQDVPVVLREYDSTHAYAAMLTSITHRGITHEFDEDLNSIDANSWKGLRAHQLMKIADDVGLHMLVSCFACKTVQQTLSRRRFDIPGWVTQHEKMSDVSGEYRSPLINDVGITVQHRQNEQALRDAYAAMMQGELVAAQG